MFAAVAAVLSVCAAPAAAATFTNSTPITINPYASSNGQGAATPYPSSINVSGLGGTTTDVNVTLNDFSHTWPEYVGVVLVAPTGHALLLQGGVGEESDVNAVDTTFDDSAAGYLPDTTAWASGSYRPTWRLATGSIGFPPPAPDFDYPGPDGPSTLASTFNGFSPNGTWTLFVRNGDDESGSIAGGWSLAILGGGQPSRTLAVSKSGVGIGSVNSTPAGIDCGAVCSTQFRHGQSVVLEAFPDNVFSFFVTWTGCDSVSVSGRFCTVSLSSNRTVNADFQSSRPVVPSDACLSAPRNCDLKALIKKCKKKWRPGKKRKKCIRLARQKVEANRP